MLVTFTILVLMSLGYFATDIYLPSLPTLAAFYQVSDSVVKLTLFSYLLSFALTPIIFGPLSDQFGRKKIMQIGLVITFIATIGCAIPVNIHWLIVWRALQGVGTGAVVVSSRAMIADLYSGKELARKISYITMLLPLIIAIAPMVGGFLQERFDWQSTFIFLAIYVAGIRFILPYLTESLKSRKKKSTSQLYKSYIHVLQTPSFLLYTLCTVLPTAGTFGYLTSSPFLFQEVLGLSPSEYGLLAIFIGGSIIVSSYINAKLLYRVETQNLQLTAGIIIFISGILLLIVYLTDALSVSTLLIPIMLFFTCIPFGSSNSASKAMEQLKGDYGAANAIVTTAQFLIGALASFAFSLITNNETLPLAICFIIVSILFSVSLFFATKMDLSDKEIAFK